MKDSKKELNQRIHELSDVIDNLCYEMDNLRDTYCELNNVSTSIIVSNGINNIKHFKEKLTDRGLNSSELEEFIDEYMKFYNE